jgi:hypothetical protein
MHDDKLTEAWIRYVPGLDKGKGLYFLFIKSETKTPGGLPAGAELAADRWCQRSLVIGVIKLDQ